MWATALGFLATVFGPIIAAAVAVWLEQKQTERAHEARDEVDQFLVKKAGGDRRALDELSRALERLQSEARRKVGHP